jgi:hypothetical protein
MGTNGRPQQLQSGDTLTGPFAEIEGISQTSEEAAGIVICSAVYSSAADKVKKGQANAAGTSNIIGLASSTFVTTGTGTVQTSGTLSATTAQWDAVAGTTGGLAFNTVYFLDPTTAGKITPTAPSTVGQSVVELGSAISTTEMCINIKQAILL